MSNLDTITAVSIAVQINGKAYFVNLPHDRAMMVMNMAGGLSDNGKLNVVPAPAGFNFTKIEDMA